MYLRRAGAGYLLHALSFAFIGAISLALRDFARTARISALVLTGFMHDVNVHGFPGASR